MKHERMGYRLFHTSFRDRDGARQQAAAWYVEIRDQCERVRRLPAFTSRKASDELGRNLVALVSYYKATGGQTDPALAAWLTALPARTQRKLAEIGLLPRERIAASRALTAHLDDWRAALLAKGNTLGHADLMTGRARKVLDGCGFAHYAAIEPGRVLSYLDGLRQDTKEKRGISAQTFNFYLSACKGFCRWLVRNRRATENPLVSLTPLNVRTDRRHDRRALTVTELRALLDTAENGPERCGMSGKARAMMYKLAVESGLRANELRTLRRASFKLDGDAPTVTVAAAYSKHRREDVLPLRLALALELREFMKGLAPAAQVFKLTPRRRYAAEAFKADLEAAGVRRTDDAGRFADMHALRHTFISNLASGGVHPAVAQRLARHSTITLTMDRYTHTLAGDQAAALDVLPDLSGPSRERARATGTDNARAVAADADPRLALCLAQTGQSGQCGLTVVDSGGRNVCSAETPEILAENANLPRKQALGRGAGVADRAGFENRLRASVRGFESLPLRFGFARRFRRVGGVRLSATRSPAPVQACCGNPRRWRGGLRRSRGAGFAGAILGVAGRFLVDKGRGRACTKRRPGWNFGPSGGTRPSHRPRRTHLHAQPKERTP